MPWRKNLRASSDVVVTGKFFVMPMPGSSRAGRSGCAPGGGAHMSGSRADCCFLPAATTSDDKADARRRSDAAKVRRFMRTVYGQEGQEGQEGRIVGLCLPAYPASPAFP